MFIYLFIYLHFKFFCSDNITPRNSKTKYYKELNLSKCSGSLCTDEASIFMGGGLKSGIVDIFILTVNCNNRNYNILVSSLK